MQKVRKVKYDSEYIKYVESGESAAVLITRDIVNSIDTTNKWVDVLLLSAYEKFGSIAFNFFVVELFERKLKPEYPKASTIEEKKYVTWQTANRDIAQQRAKNVRGPKYLILSNLIDVNRGKYDLVKGTWDTLYNHWIMDGRFTETSEYRMKKKPKPPKYEYIILGVRKITNKQIDYIEANEEDIIDEIIFNRRPKMEFFYQ